MKKMPVVDKQERERIRRGLLNYRRAHNIGAPELQQRMLYQLYKGERRKFEHTIALSTLQRFLKGKRRTGDRTVLRYAEFLSLAEPPEIDDDLGLGLVRFFTAKMPVQTTTDGFARVYRAYMKDIHLGIPLKARLYSRLHLTPNLQSSYFRVVSEEIPLPPIDPRRLGNGIRRDSAG